MGYFLKLQDLFQESLGPYQVYVYAIFMLNPIGLQWFEFEFHNFIENCEKIWLLIATDTCAC